MTNILFLFPDQQRWDTVSCYGRPLFPGLTPHLDRMAAGGVRFEHAFTPQPVCGPARACLQTGVYATETGCFKNDAVPGGDRYVEECLHDLDADPHERNNRVTDPELAGVRAELAALLVRRMAEAGEAPPKIEPANPAQAIPCR
jgi:arylsulfatase A-like enzyme